MSTFLKCLWYNQRLIIYPHGFQFMMEEGDREVLKPTIPYKDVELVAKDGVKLRCYLLPPYKTNKPLRGTVILFHGNAMNHGDFVVPHAVLFCRMGFTVLTQEYRGYGLSEGTPSESGLRMDAQAGFDYVMNDAALAESPIVIFGQSLGGAVAIDVASRNADKIAALVIENTFASVPSLVSGWPMGGFLKMFITQKWDSESKVSGLPPTLPILMLSGERDEVIPSSQMAILWDVAGKRKVSKDKRRWSVDWKSMNCAKPSLEHFKESEKEGEEDDTYTPPKRDTFRTFERGGHNDTYTQSGYWDAVTNFLNDVVPAP